MTNMFEKVKKKKIGPMTSNQERPNIVCGACGYTRKESDTNHTWQCPSCKAAYIKTDKARNKYSQTELKKRNTNYQRKKKQERIESSIETGTKGIGFGIATVLSGASSACSGAAANPFVQAIGVIIAIGSIAYLLLKIGGS